MKTTTNVVFAASLLLLPLIIKSQEKNPFSDEIDVYEEFLENQMEADRIPGLSVGFYKGDYMWTEGYGYIDLENKVEATGESAYRLASNTKSMTAVVILQLQEEGKLDIDDSVREYVPYFPRKRWEITLRQLMGHIGGISHYQDYEEEGSIKEHKDTREAIEIFEDFDLVDKPGTKYNYSSYGYNLLGAAVEGAAGMRYGEYLRKNIWEPLDMDHTLMDVPDKIISNRAEGYRLEFGELKKSEFVNMSSRFAAGGARSTVVDMLKYARGMNNKTVLSEKSTRMMETSMNTADGRRTDYGMGWHVDPVNGHFKAYHTGGQPETRTMLLRFPAEDFAIALAYNLEGGSLRAIARRLYQLIMDEAWNVKPYSGNKFDKALINGIWDVYNYGMAYYDYRSKPRNTHPGEMERSFRFLNNTLNPDSLRENFETVKQKIDLGIHPKAKKAYVRVGSHMIASLVDHYGKDRMEYYHKNGAFALFEDYLELTPSQGNRWPVNEGLTEKIRAYQNDWSETWSGYNRQLFIASWNDPDEILQRLSLRAAEKSIHPDYTSKLANALFEKFLDENGNGSVDPAEQFISLYPESAVPYLTKGHLHILKGEKDQAESAYRRGLKAKVDRHAASAGVLNYYAQRLFDRNRLDEALNLLDVAENIHPEDAGLNHTRADIYREMSRRQYEKALEKDPGLEDAWEGLQEIE
ncbi:MAG: serine hydrolase [Bacteroidales bacterium]